MDIICGHTDRKYYAKGMCSSCYSREKSKRLRALGYPNKSRLADCHPDKPHYSKGMCYQCYERKRNRTRNRRRREETIEKLGGRCACCDENRFEFLAIDHIHGGGNKHHKRRPGGGVLIDIKREGYPRDKYRVLCYNCNNALGIYGFCPHRKKEQ